MRILTTMLKGLCTYWAPGAVDLYGKPSYATPVQLRCRWEDLNWMTVTAGGEQLDSWTQVYVEVDLLQGGFLLNKPLAQVANLALPASNFGAYEIKRFGKLPTLKYDQFLRIAYL